MPVAREDMVKGYEFAKDQYVMFTPEELKALEEAGTQTADITEFVPIEAIDPVYFDKAYYLAPDKGGAKPYALLAQGAARIEALRARALGRARQAVHRDDPPGGRRPRCMQQLLYAGEVRSIRDIDIPKTDVQGRRAEARPAADRAADRPRRSIRARTPTRCATRIEAAVQKKVEGQEITHGRGARSGGAQVIDLMEALRASLEKKAPARGEDARAARAARKPPKRAQRAEAAPRGRRAKKVTRADMHQYGVREVEKLLRLPRSTIRALIQAGFVTPTRGPRNAWRFSFQDLIVLRTAQALAAARVPRRRITRSLKELRRHLPDAMPLSGLRICAVAERVVVKEGARRWQAESGQYLLAFEGDPAAGVLKVIQADKPAVQTEVEDGYELHEAGRLQEAEAAYRNALETHGPDALSLYNLGVLLQDMDRKPEAVESYEAALELDPAMADGHYNLALLCEELGRAREAIRHMAQYRRLTAAKK